MNIKKIEQLQRNLVCVQDCIIELTKRVFDGKVKMNAKTQDECRNMVESSLTLLIKADKLLSNEIDEIISKL